MNADIICFCHLRWNFVYQRPQHLLSRFTWNHRVFFIEEPEWGATMNHAKINVDESSMVWVIVPQLKEGLSALEAIAAQREILDSLLASMQIKNYIFWYYSPMALAWSDHLKPDLIVYDCMDELSAFKFAPPELIQRERVLFKKADIVFTGGQSLYEAKKHLHFNIYPFPSSIDKSHFGIARKTVKEPDDQQLIPHPRLGFFGVLDERFDLALISALADLRPHWHLVLIGPVVKIDPATLPQRNNIHYLGSKSYKELPHYLAGWDIAIMPFAINEATRFISPTKTPEYLAGGKPVIATPIQDVVVPYGIEGLVHIAATADAFVAAGETILNNKNNKEWLSNVDAYLSGISWDKTWQGMSLLIREAMKSKPDTQSKANEYV
jgi:UDP-galactopyranose mutase